MAKIWGTKFDIISPVWLQVVRLPNGGYKINGEHDVDSGWIKDVRNAAHHKNKSNLINVSIAMLTEIINFNNFQSFLEFYLKILPIRTFPSF